MDAVHPHYTPFVGYGWIKRSERKALATTTAHPRLNINGAINIDNVRMVVDYQAKLNKESIKDFIELLRKHQPMRRIYLICDRASYYCNHDVETYAKSSGVKLIYLPAYSPNLNLIERVWLYFKKLILHNRYYGSFAQFKQACKDFFADIQRHRSALSTSLTENFQRFDFA